jgi:hypothetical protein
LCRNPIMAGQPGEVDMGERGDFGDSGIADQDVSRPNCSTEVATSRSRSAGSVTSESLRSPSIRCRLCGLAVLARPTSCWLTHPMVAPLPEPDPNIDPDAPVPDDPGELLPDAPEPPAARADRTDT